MNTIRNRKIVYSFATSYILNVPLSSPLTKKAMHCCMTYFILLQTNDMLCLRTTLGFHKLKFHACFRINGFISFHNQLRIMKENILSTLMGNKSIPYPVPPDTGKPYLAGSYLVLVPLAVPPHRGRAFRRWCTPCR